VLSVPRQHGRERSDSHVEAEGNQRGHDDVELAQQIESSEQAPEHGTSDVAAVKEAHP